MFRVKSKAKKILSLIITMTVLLTTMSFSAFAADTNIAPLATASTSFCSSWESITALNDGYEPTSSNDRAHAVYGNWDNPGTTQWVQYDFTKSYTISKSDVYWFDDNEGIDLPASCAIKYWNGSAWVNVSNPSGLGVLGNQYNTTTFTPVTTTRIRLEITAKPSYSTGILEWRVWGSEESTPPPEMAAHYKFDETSGTQASDSSGNGKTAILTGATWTSGRSGNAVNLSGSNQYVSLPSGIVSGLNDFTVATWVKLDTRSNWSRIFDFGTGTSYYMFLTPSSSGNTVRFAIKNGGTEQQINSTSALPTGAWKHVAVTLSGTTATLYIDGVAAGTNSSMSIKPSSLGNTNLNYIGRSMYSSDPYLDGLVDDFRIYGRALSASEVSALAGGGTPVNTAPVVNAGNDASITLPASASLSGTATDDGLPSGTLTYSWSKVSGPGNVTFGNSSALNTTASFSSAGTYVLRLTASDGELSSSDTVTITVYEQGSQPLTNVAPQATVTTDYVTSGYNVNAVKDGYEPSSSSDSSHGYYNNYNTPATKHWVQYEFSQPQRFTRCDVYWYSNNNTIKAPRMYEYQYWDGTDWVSVYSPSAYELDTNRYCTTTFIPFTASKIRLLLTNLSTTSSGIIEWKAYTGGPATNITPSTEAGPMSYFTLPANIELKGIVVDDGLPAGSSLVSTWTVHYASGVATIANPNSPNTTVSVSQPGKYVFKLTSTDGELTSYDYVTVNVYANGATSYSNKAASATVTSSNTLSGYTTAAVKDGYTPSSSSDTSRGAYANSGSTQTLDMEFGQAYLFNQAEIYWLANGSTIDVPASYKLYYWNGKEYVKAYQQSGLGTAINQFNTTTFCPIYTNKLRVEMTAKSGKQAGIIEMRVNGCTPGAIATNIADQAEPTASYTASGTSLKALNDGKNPTSSGDTSKGVYAFNPQTSMQYIDYTFNSTMSVDKIDVYWYVSGSNIAVPASYAIKYWNGSAWVSVSNASGLGVAANQFNTTSFTKVNTTKLRLEITPSSGKSAGVIEWKVFGNHQITAPPSWVNSFYTKSVSVFGIPIVATSKVSDQALCQAANVINAELRKLAVVKPAVIAKLVSNRSRCVIVGMSEFNYQHPGQEGNAHDFRGAYGGNDNFNLEEELFIPPDMTRFFEFSVNCHEFAHTLHFAIEGSDTTLKNQIIAAYNNAIALNLYTESSYDRGNVYEYFAGQVGRWFNSNPTHLNVSDAKNKPHRQQLQEYDPTMYNLLASIFGEYELTPPWVD